MLELPSTFILFDTEYTAWEGAQARGWSGPSEHKEIVQIGAIVVDGQTLKEEDSFEVLIRPAINPMLSQYFIDLTGITQADVDKRGVDVAAALTQFASWSRDRTLYCFGTDGQVVMGQCELASIPCSFTPDRFADIRPVFQKRGIPAEQYMSSTIVTAFGIEPARRGHSGLADSRSILDGLVALATRQLSLSTSE